MSDFLSDMAANSLERAAAVKTAHDTAAMRELIAAAPPPVPLRLHESGFDLIAEAKLASPSEGRLAPGDTPEVVALAREYERAGAAAISVLTEETRFAGSMTHLEAASAAVSVPVMRKDFLVDPIQIGEARVAGASGVLLIARLLPGDLLVEMTDLTLDLGMFALIEVFDRSDLETAIRVFDRDVLIGVNSRDLASLEVDADRFESLAPHLPDGLPAVAESGIESTEDITSLARLGYRLALVGSALTKSDDHGERLATLIAAGRVTRGEMAG